MPIGNTVTVINRSGKVVSTGKHLKGVWEEAKAAYQSRKAEIAAGREHEFQERRARLALEQASLSDGDHQVRRVKRAGSVAGSQSTRRSRHHRADDHHRHPEHGHRRGSHQHELRSPGSESGSRYGHHPHHPRPSPLARGYTDSAFTNDHAHEHPSQQPDSFEPPDRAMVRRNTLPPRPGTADSYDENLAYGSMPPALPVKPSDAEVQLRGEMSKLTRLLDEANCLQKSATAMVEHLQKNPDALAAVGLTLAEISALVKKVGPLAFMNMKTAFPAVAALLASPQFLIAGGLAVGVTVVMFGGYKIVQRMKAIKELAEGEGEDGADGEMDELRELEGDLSRIEVWRRGIADAEAESVGTTVEGEFVTPIATQHMLAEGMITQENLKPLKSKSGAKSEKSHRTRKADSVRSGTTVKTRKHHSSKSRAADSVAGSTRSRKDKEKEKEKEKKFTPLKGLKLLLNGKP